MTANRIILYLIDYYLYASKIRERGKPRIMKEFA